MADENYPRGQWPLALVTGAITSKDGYVLTVKVKTSSTVSTSTKGRLRNEHYDINSSSYRMNFQPCACALDGVFFV